MKKRTKAQKIHAQQQRQTQQVAYTYTAKPNSAAVTATSPQPVAVLSQPVRNRTQELFPYDIHLIYGDLRKTVIIVVILFVALGLIAHFKIGI